VSAWLLQDYDAAAGRAAAPAAGGEPFSLTSGALIPAVLDTIEGREVSQMRARDS